MEDDIFSSFRNHRFSSISSDRDSVQYDFSEADPDDPISAYFKKRCENATKSYFKRHAESDSDSSVGVIDVENVSLFGDIGVCENSSDNLQKMRTSFPVPEEVKNVYGNGKGKSSDITSNQMSDFELNLKKQRTLAQKVLLNFNNKMEESHQENSQGRVERNKDSHVLIDVSNKLPHTNFLAGKEPEKNWFQPNYSPNTPRHFNDELSSFGGEESLLARSDVRYSLPLREIQSQEQQLKQRQSQYSKKISSLSKELNQLTIAEDLEFKCESPEELIRKLEEDEKQFKMDNSGLLHNSAISNFSGASEELSKWPSSSNLKQDFDDKKISIGQFFNMRSNRISSLVGSSESIEKQLQSPQDKDMDPILHTHEQSLPISNVSKVDRPKPRRCLSTLDLKQTPDAASRSRYSNDSSTSNSTVMIQNILAEMESGLSGSQIYEKLLKTYGMHKRPMGEKSPVTKTLEPLGNKETPKSSKTPKRKEGDRKMETNNFRKNIDHQRLTPSPECKESVQWDLHNGREDLNSDRSISLLRDEKIKMLKGKKGFDASTPKLQHSKKQDDRFKSGCQQVLAEKEIWEVPKISFIQPTVDLNRTGVSEDTDKTLTFNSNSLSDSTRRPPAVAVNDTCTIEDTITAGDLTVLSQRIEEMKDDGVCIVRSKESEEPVLLTVVQKLADLPKGSVDCSSLTPLLRDQFPELLSTFPTPASDQTQQKSSFATSYDKTQDILVSEPGDWVKLPARMGFNEKIHAFAEVKKNIFVPLSNTSKNWLLASIDSLNIMLPNGNKLLGVKTNDEWNVCDFVSLSMKETIVPPESQQTLQISFVSKIQIKVDLNIKFVMKQLLGKEIQVRNVILRTHNINPVNSINIIPKDSINFGVIADQCFDQRTFQLTFDGTCELPLLLYTEEEGGSHFFLKPLVPFSGGEWRDDKFHIRLREGEKQLIEFLVFFQPNTLLNSANETQDFRASLVLQIGCNTDSDGILQRIPIKGSVSFAKFYWNAACSPLVFRVPEKGRSLTRSFPLKNVGSLPIAFSIKIEDEDGNAEDKDGIFVAPKSFYLSRNEESVINITFNANAQENCVKRLLILQIKPNGRAKYDVELIGLISPPEGRPLSRASNASLSTKSLSNTESQPVKLLATTHSLSWASVSLEKEVRQTFQLKNASCLVVTARITFKNNSGAFRLVNENGERVQKIRKMLKPDCPFNLTVAFRPDFLGPHHNALFIETNHISGKKMILLNGIGGMPNLFIGNVKSDLNGYKMISLQSSQSGCQMFSNTLEFKNGGRIPGFILIKPNVEALTLCYELSVSPSCCVIPPDSKITVKLSQKFKNDDLHQLLSGKDISKVATLSIVMGDEPSRLRLRKLLKTGSVKLSDRSKILTAPYEGEQEMNIKSFDDPPSFENQFLKSLRVVEVAVVIERSSGVCDPTILLDEDETLDGFVTICSAAESTITSSVIQTNRNPSESESHNSKNKSPVSNNTFFSAESTSQNKIAKWLETLECPPKKG